VVVALVKEKYAKMISAQSNTLVSPSPAKATRTFAILLVLPGTGAIILLTTTLVKKDISATRPKESVISALGLNEELLTMAALLTSTVKLV
jgi:hypothetical protein